MFSLLFAIAITIIATKLFGELARRFGQPSVIGELVAGVLLGGSALAVLDPREPSIHALAEIGVFILLFQIGLHTDVRSLKRVGGSALMVACAGVVLPFAAGFAIARAFGVAALPSVIAGAALTATSVAISARVLAEAGVSQTEEGNVVLGAALADDVIGLVVLSVVVSMVGGAAFSAGGVARTSLVSIGFIAASLVIGWYAMPPLFGLLDRLRGEGSHGMFGIALGLLLAALAIWSGSSLIIGAFVGGVILHPTLRRQEIEHTARQLSYFFVPIFFAAVGASVDLGAFASLRALMLGGALIAVALAGKVAAGYAPWWFKGNKLMVGVAMVPRGEVGLIFAQMGLSTGVITPELFGAIMLTVMVTTLVAPPLLNAVIARDEDLDRVEFAPPDSSQPYDGRRLTAAGRKQTPTHRR